MRLLWSSVSSCLGTCDVASRVLPTPPSASLSPTGSEVSLTCRCSNQVTPELKSFLWPTLHCGLAGLLRAASSPAYLSGLRSALPPPPACALCWSLLDFFHRLRLTCSPPPGPVHLRFPSPRIYLQLICFPPPRPLALLPDAPLRPQSWLVPRCALPRSLWLAFPPLGTHVAPRLLICSIRSVSVVPKKPLMPEQGPCLSVCLFTVSPRAQPGVWRGAASQHCLCGQIRQLVTM